MWGPSETPCGPSWPWPGVLPYLPSGPDALAGVRPLAGAGGLLNLTVPLGTLTGASSAPGQLSRLGVITPGQARHLATVAAWHPATRWRIVIVTPDGEAIAVTHLPRSRSPAAGGGENTGYGENRGGGENTGGCEDTGGQNTGGGQDAPAGLIGRVTLVVRTDQLPPAAGHDPPGEQLPGVQTPGEQLPGEQPSGERAHRQAPAAAPGRAALARILERAMAAAARAAAAAEQRRRQDEESGGCGHGLASAAYRPPARIAELVIARDCTCRFGPCRRPAEQCDLDHVVPFDQGGLTCSCNLGGKCRSHHQLKQHPRWSVTQPIPGTFCWTTPAGRTYVTRPDPYLT